MLPRVFLEALNIVIPKHKEASKKTKIFDWLWPSSVSMVDIAIMHISFHESGSSARKTKIQASRIVWQSNTTNETRLKSFLREWATSLQSPKDVIRHDKENWEQRLEACVQTDGSGQFKYHRVLFDSQIKLSGDAFAIQRGVVSGVELSTGNTTKRPWILGSNRLFTCHVDANCFQGDDRVDAPGAWT